ncbi:g8165 [Coccomyxa viridis]|uniref:G8165 protein n=1 Tax=Coccomyxa viridis TaxID=1274662 RepID=A0ABP1G6F1_9CHLO
MFPKEKWKILRGDKVIITAGKDKGQTGIVTKVIRDERIPKVIVEGRNLNKRAIKRTADNPGGLISMESPLHYSNVMLADPVTGRPVRVGWRYLEDGTKVRISKGKLASGSIVPRPEILKQRRTPLPFQGTKDSGVPDALEVTYKPGDWPSALPVPDPATTIIAGRPTYLQARQQRTKNGSFFRGFSASALF